jgi:hypothetical protein
MEGKKNGNRENGRNRLNAQTFESALNDNFLDGCEKEDLYASRI